MAAALAIFLLSYVVIAGGRLPGFTLDRPSGAALGALAMVLGGVVTPREAVGAAINYDTLLLLLGTMVINGYLEEADVFRYASWLTLTHVHTRRGLLVSLVFVSGFLSALLVNDTVCVMITPLVVRLIKDARLPPLPFLVALAFGANAGSVATPVGNPQNMIIATLSHISYLQFVAALLLPALAALAFVAAILLYLFWDELRDVTPIRASLERPALQTGLAALGAATLVGVVVAFCLGTSLPWTALTGAGVLTLFGRRPPRSILERIDWVLLLFFASLFVITYGVGKAGIAQALFDQVSGFLGTRPEEQAGRFGLFTVIASQIVSNVPFVLLAAHWMPHFADTKLMWISMALFSTLAGNLTTVGSVANLIVLEGARRTEPVGFVRFLRIGAPVTAVTIAVAFAVLLAERRLGLF